MENQEQYIYDMATNEINKATTQLIRHQEVLDKANEKKDGAFVRSDEDRKNLLELASMFETFHACTLHPLLHEVKRLRAKYEPDRK